MPLKAVIFDLDCTLTCRKSTISAAAKRIAEIYADHLEPDCLPALEKAFHTADNFGYRDRRAFFDEIFSAACWRKRPAMDEAMEWWTHRFGECNVLHGEALPLLSEIRRRGMKLGLITNGSAITQQAKLDQLAIAPLFDHVVISGKFGKNKPDPAIFQYSCETLDVQPAEAVYVGDHAHNDITGAEAAGLHAVWISTGGPWPDDLPKPDRQIASLSELPGVLNTL